MQNKQSNKNEQKVPEFTVTPNISFLDIYFRTNYRVQSALEGYCRNLVVLPTNRTDGCNCTLCQTVKYADQPDPDSDLDGFDDFEAYLSHYEPAKGYRAVARFNKMPSYFIEDLMRDDFEYDEFFIKKVQYVFDFKSKNQDELLEIITESIKIDLNSTVYENIHAYIETCEVADSNETIIRLNIVLSYPNRTGIGSFRETILELNEILDCISFYVFDQDTFLSALTNQCMHITDSQMESLKKQIQDIANIMDL